MERRSDRYANIPKEPPKRSRVQKNEYLYDELNSRIGYQEIDKVPQQAPPRIDLSTLDVSKLNREDYQKIRQYRDILPEEKEKPVQPKEELTKPKNFDINAVLEEAKRTREVDELEQKRNLKDEEYSVLSNLNKKYLHDKNFDEEESEELKELINTITSKTLVNDIKDEEEKELLSDLLATTIDIKLENELSKTEINKLYDGEIPQKDDDDDEEEMDNSFYTKSMELSKSDLIEKEDDDEEIDEEGSHFGIKIIAIILLLVAALAVVGYFLLKHLGVAFQ